MRASRRRPPTASSSSRPASRPVAKRKRKGSGLAQSMGGILAGFDQQVFRTTPPPHELVQKGTRLPAVPADDGGTLTIHLPGDATDDEDRATPPDEPEPPVTG